MLFNSGYHNTLKAYHRIAGSWFPKYRDWVEFLQRMTAEKYQALVYYNHQRSSDTAYVSFKCEVPKPWKLKFQSPV